MGASLPEPDLNLDPDAPVPDDPGELLGRMAAEHPHQTACPGAPAPEQPRLVGIALGPVTGKLLAQRIATGVAAPPELVPFDPLR